MPAKSSTVVEFWRRITAKWFRVDLTTSPGESRKVFLSNLVNETIAHLVGKGDGKCIPIEATSSGEMKVATAGTAIESYDYSEATAANDDAISVPFATVVSSFSLLVDDQDASVRFSIDGSTWGEWFTIKVGESLAHDLRIHTMEIKNAGAGANHSYRVWGWY